MKRSTAHAVRRRVSEREKTKSKTNSKQELIVVKEEVRAGRQSREPERGMRLRKTGEVSLDGEVISSRRSGDDGGEETRIDQTRKGTLQLGDGGSGKRREKTVKGRKLAGLGKPE